MADSSSVVALPSLNICLPIDSYPSMLSALRSVRASLFPRLPALKVEGICSSPASDHSGAGWKLDRNLKEPSYSLPGEKEDQVTAIHEEDDIAEHEEDDIVEHEEDDNAEPADIVEPRHRLRNRPRWLRDYV